MRKLFKSAIGLFTGGIAAAFATGAWLGARWKSRHETNEPEAHAIGFISN